MPNNNEATIGEACHILGYVALIELYARRVGICPEFGASRIAVGIISLAENAVTRTILTIGIPYDDKSAIRQSRHCGDILPLAGMGVNLEFTASCIAARIIALPKYSVITTILVGAAP